MKLTAWPRVHLGLIDLGGVTERRYGGAGCAIAGPAVELQFEPAEQLFLDLAVEVGDRTVADLRRLESELGESLGGRGARVEVTAIPPQHVGLGSKTALLLGVAAAAAAAAEVDLDRAKLQHLSGRGGTSGEGVNLFFDGGFIVDGGHPASSEGRFGPSSSTRPNSVPPVLARHPIPDHWSFQLILGGDSGLSGQAEQDLFDAATPLAPEEVLQALAAIHHAVLPGFALADLGLVARGLAVAHRFGFKSRELEAQPDRVRGLYRELVEIPSLAVGLSSVGPLLFAISDSERSRAQVTAVAQAAEARLLGPFAPVNSGYSVEERT